MSWCLQGLFARLDETGMGVGGVSVFACAFSCLSLSARSGLLCLSGRVACSRSVSSRGEHAHEDWIVESVMNRMIGRREGLRWGL